MDENAIAACVMDISFDLHRRLGPGLLESAYEALLERKLLDAGIAVARQVEVPIVLDGIKVETAFRADLIVGGKVVVELKSVDEVHPVH